MNEQVVAKIYAKSITELCDQNKINACDELTKLQLVINENNYLENLLFLEVFTIEEKKSVLEEVAKKIALSPIITHSLIYLVDQRRIGLFPLIYRDIVVIDDHKKGFMKGVIEGPEDQIDSEIKNRLLAYLKGIIGKEIELSYTKNESITAGNRVTVGDLQLDATLENQLNKLKQEIVSSRNIRG